MSKKTRRRLDAAFKAKVGEAMVPSTTKASAWLASVTRRTNSSGSCRVKSRHSDCQLIASSSICGSCN